VFVIVNVHHIFQSITLVCMVVELGPLVCIAYLSCILFFLRSVANTLREGRDLQQVCFEIKLRLTHESKKEKVVKNGEHYTKRKYMIYTPSSSLLWY